MYCFYGNWPLKPVGKMGSYKTYFKTLPTKPGKTAVNQESLTTVVSDVILYWYRLEFQCKTHEVQLI